MVEAPAVQAEEEAVAAPTHPTPAFVPPDNGSCLRAYRLLDGICVHRFYEQTSPTGMERALSAYKRGVAPPMLGPMPLPPTPDKHTRSPLGPGSLTKTRLDQSDAGSPRDKRLTDLDAMLAAAREKLRERDEAAKAKHVENAPKRQPPTPASATSTGITSAGTFAQGASAASGVDNSIQARLNELSQIASQLSGEQLRQLATDLGKSGVNTNALDSVLQQEHNQGGL